MNVHGIQDRFQQDTGKRTGRKSLTDLPEFRGEKLGLHAIEVHPGFVGQAFLPDSVQRAGLPTPPECPTEGLPR